MQRTNDLLNSLIDWAASLFVARRLVFVIIWGGGLIAPVPNAAAFQAEIGYNDLVALLGEKTPTGTGVAVSQVEANEGSSYMPNLASSEFTGKTIVDGTGDSSSVSNHSHNMARQFYGNITSVASEISDVTIYEADDYLMNVLDVSGGDPTVQNFQVQNHSWIGGYEDNGNPRTALNVQALRRFDFTIDTYEMTSVIGLNNGSSSPQPNFWAHSYNAIAVGRSDGNHSTGTTTISSYGPNRTRPDVVAPRGTTSASTAVTSSVAALLHESGAGTSAVRSEPMKAIIMAGATKDEFPGWSHSSTQPLDPRYGAGEINVLNSYRIQDGGEFDGSTSAPSATAGDFGWDYGMVDATTSQFYNLEIPEFYTGAELSIVLAWNLKVTDNNTGSAFSPTHSLTNLDLRLYDSSTTFMGTLVDESVSTIDNVEHIYVTDLAAGTYTIEVSAGGARDFGLAWRLTTVPPPRVTGDYNGDGTVGILDYVLWRDALGTDANLTADGDLSGIVDQGDYDVWVRSFGTSASGNDQVALSTSEPLPTKVPEPFTLPLLIFGACGIGHARVRYG